jgi:hypothetical protein
MNMQQYNTVHSLLATECHQQVTPSLHNFIADDLKRSNKLGKNSVINEWNAMPFPASDAVHDEGRVFRQKA